MTRRRSGITLVEVLVALVLFSLVIGLLFDTFVTSFRTFDSRSERLDVLQEMHLLVALMRRDLRSAVWAPDTPFLVLPAGLAFYRVAGVKVGGDGNVGLPELRIVQYEWDPRAQGILRRFASEEGVEEHLYLAGKVEPGGFRVQGPDSTAAAGPTTGSGVPPPVMHVEIACKPGLRHMCGLTVSSRYMGPVAGDAQVSGWYDNYRVHPSSSSHFPAMADYRMGVRLVPLTDRDQLKDLGYAMGGGLLGSLASGQGGL